MLGTRYLLERQASKASPLSSYWNCTLPRDVMLNTVLDALDADDAQLECLRRSEKCELAVNRFYFMNNVS